MHLESYARTDIGPVRETNEDSLWIDLEQGVFIVADGMGGHAAGEVASRIAVETTHRILTTQTFDPEETRLVRDVDSIDGADVLRERMRYAMNQASIQIRREVERNPATRDMGTTVVVLVVDGDQAHLAHVGDSRAYLIRDGRIIRLTRDHTVVQQEIDAGRLTPELARLVPHKHILTQSVGYHGTVEPDTTTRMLRSGDTFVLCTDGLTDPLDDEAICKVAMDNPGDLMADALTEAALEAGGEDNVTVLTVHISH